jgi:hypothetical protein
VDVLAIAARDGAGQVKKLEETIMTLQIVLAIAGSAALLIGLFGGGVKAKEIEVPTLARGARILSSLVGIILIGAAIWLSFPDSLPFRATSTVTPMPTNEPIPTQTQIIPSLPAPTVAPTNTPLPAPTITPTYTASQLPTLPPALVEVFANQSWQTSGVNVKNGDTIQITYITGRWNVRGDFELTDPFGSTPGDDVTTDPECHFPILPSVAGHQALVAKIGENGEPFNPFKRIRMGDGLLYLRINDCDKYLYDNSGSVSVRIQLIR